MAEEPQLLIVGGARRGRPSRAGTRADRALRVWLTQDEGTELERVAAIEGKKVAELVRDAVNEYVADCGERRVFKAGPFE